MGTRQEEMPGTQIRSVFFSCQGPGVGSSIVQKTRFTLGSWGRREALVACRPCTVPGPGPTTAGPEGACATALFAAAVAISGPLPQDEQPPSIGRQPSGSRRALPCSGSAQCSPGATPALEAFRAAALGPAAQPSTGEG